MKLVVCRNVTGSFLPRNS